MTCLGIASFSLIAGQGEFTIIVGVTKLITNSLCELVSVDIASYLAGRWNVGLVMDHQ